MNGMADRFYPRWYQDYRINENLFCEEFLIENPMKSINGTFFTKDGRVDDEEALRKKIYDKIELYVPTGVSKKVNTLIEAMKLRCYAPNFPLDETIIHVANGTYNLASGFSERKEYCRNRLSVNYNPDAPKPETWLRFLSELLEEEDILTLQEYIGYCLIPTTKAQKMLIIVGKGGEGKSRIGVVLRSIFGTNMNMGSISKVETNSFARADLEHRLLLVDDDLKLEALPQTNIIKSIITAELPMDLERKGKQSYQGLLYARFLALGNGSLQSLYDRSEGFFRRQIILSTKDKPADREDDPFIGDKMCREKEGIFLWALDGLERLFINNMRFTISERAKANLRQSRADANNAAEFMQSEGYIKYGEDYQVSSGALYEVYRQWCDDNATPPLASKSFIQHVKENMNVYGLKYSNHIHIGAGRMARGFTGIDITRGSRFDL